MSRPAPFEILRLAADTMRLEAYYNPGDDKRLLKAVAAWLDKTAEDGWTGEALDVARIYLAGAGDEVDT